MNDDREQKIIVPIEFMCPIEQRIMNDPVTVNKCHVFERRAIETWHENKNTCPLTREEIQPPWESNETLRNQIEQFLQQHPEMNNVDHRVSDGECLEHAIRSENCADIVKLVTRMKNNYAIINRQNEKKENVLHLVCQYGNRTQAQQLITALGPMAISFACLETANKFNALHLACAWGDSAMVSSIIQALGDQAANAALAQSNQQLNALHLACARGDRAMVSSIIQALGDQAANAALAQSNEQLNALHLACTRGDSAIVSSIIRALGDQAANAALAQNKNQWNALHTACDRGDNAMNVIQALGDQAANAALAQTKGQWNALHFACIKGDNAMVSNIIQALGNQAANAASVQSESQWNALHIACRRGDNAIVSSIIQALGDQAADAALAQTKGQWNALHVACARGDNDIVSSIIQALGSNKLKAISDTNNKGQTPVDIAREKGFADIVTLLESQQNPVLVIEQESFENSNLKEQLAAEQLAYMDQSSADEEKPKHKRERAIAEGDGNDSRLKTSKPSQPIAEESPPLPFFKTKSITKEADKTKTNNIKRQRGSEHDPDEDLGPKKHN